MSPRSRDPLFRSTHGPLPPMRVHAPHAPHANRDAYLSLSLWVQDARSNTHHRAASRAKPTVRI